MRKLRGGVIGAGGIADRRTIPGMMRAANAEQLRAKYAAKYACIGVEAAYESGKTKWIITL